MFTKHQNGFNLVAVSAQLPGHDKNNFILSEKYYLEMFGKYFNFRIRFEFKEKEGKLDKFCSS